MVDRGTRVVIPVAVFGVSLLIGFVTAILVMIYRDVHRQRQLHEQQSYQQWQERSDKFWEHQLVKDQTGKYR